MFQALKFIILLMEFYGAGYAQTGYSKIVQYVNIQNYVNHQNVLLTDQTKHIWHDYWTVVRFTFLHGLMQIFPAILFFELLLFLCLTWSLTSGILCFWAIHLEHFDGYHFVLTRFNWQFVPLFSWSLYI